MLSPGFEFNRRQHAVVRVLALRVLEHLNVVEHVLPCGFAGQVGTAVRYDKRRNKRRNCIESMFGRLNDWRRIATRYD